MSRCSTLVSEQRLQHYMSHISRRILDTASPKNEVLFNSKHTKSSTSRLVSLSLTPSLTPETLHTLLWEETTHMNFRTISWSQHSFVNQSLYNFIWCMVFILYYFELIYNQCPYNIFSCIYTYQYVLLCVLNKDQSISLGHFGDGLNSQSLERSCQI